MGARDGPEGRAPRGGVGTLATGKKPPAAKVARASRRGATSPATAPEAGAKGKGQGDEPKRGPGRPPAEILPDAKVIKNLAAIQCTVEEIAAVCEVSKDTIERHFAALIKAGRDEGRASIRRMQYKLMNEEKSVAMAIWLGKVVLKQREVIKHVGDPKEPIPIKHDVAKGAAGKLARLLGVPPDKLPGSDDASGAR